MSYNANNWLEGQGTHRDISWQRGWTSHSGAQLLHLSFECFHVFLHSLVLGCYIIVRLQWPVELVFCRLTTRTRTQIRPVVRYWSLRMSTSSTYSTANFPRSGYQSDCISVETLMECYKSGISTIYPFIQADMCDEQWMNAIDLTQLHLITSFI